MKRKYVVGIDVGGTKIRAVLWNGKKVLRAHETQTPTNFGDFKKVLCKLGWGRINKIGVGAAGVVSGKKLVQSPNIPYIKNFYFQTKLDNDARCFARAELLDIRRPIGRRMYLFLTLGTGVGRAIAKNRRVLNIKKFEYPERWEKEYQKVRDSRDNKKLAEFLGKKLSRIINLYCPQIIIAGGGVAARPGFLKLLQKYLKIKIQKSKFGKNAVAIGAATLFQ